VPLASDDFIDVPGRSRWYKFDVLPGQRIKIDLSGLPADYDLAVFKDIGATFCQLVPSPGTLADYCRDVLGASAGATTASLTKLSAEYAPSAFSPSAFSPSAFSPSAFSPSAFSPSAFSPDEFAPSAFSPSAFSPSAFSPSAFSPSAFSPSAFSPSAFSPSAFSPSAFSPSAFSPSAFSAEELASAFSSAQTRSIIGVSATPGFGNELVVVNSWNNAGSFYIRVSSRGGAYSTAANGMYHVAVDRGPTSCYLPLASAPRGALGATYRTLVLTDSSSVPGYSSALRDKINGFLTRSEVAPGLLVDVASDARVVALKAQAACYSTNGTTKPGCPTSPDGDYDNRACPAAMNIVAEEVKAIVDANRSSALRYIVIAGNDDAIPFFRYPDQSLLGPESQYVPPVEGDSPSEASLRNDYVLSQDAFGSATLFSLRTSDFPVPGAAVGRLVESADEIGGMIDAYVATNGFIRPGSSLVTGYDFLADAATAVADELQAGTGSAPDTLITPNTVSPQVVAPQGVWPASPPASWTATHLAAKLFGSRHDVVFLAGHFSAQSTLAADFASDLLTYDVAAADDALFNNALIFSAGCHSGYNLVDAAAIPGVTLPLDWAQVFARKKATLVAGTGYQYGDTDFLEYSERIYRNFAQQLRAASGADPYVRVGEALVKAKLAYLASTPDIRGIHEKALLEATLFGLPMLGVDMPHRESFGSGGAGVVSPVAAASKPGADTGLRTAALTVAPIGLVENTTALTSVEPPAGTILANWLAPNAAESALGGRVVTNPLEPAVPMLVRNVTPNDSTLVLRGVGFMGGSYTDATVTPLTGAATTELRGVHVPFVSPVFYPMRLATINYFGALSGTSGTSLLLTPVQHRAANIAQAESVRRTFSSLSYKLYYSANRDGAGALSDAPSIVSALALPNGAGGVEFTAEVVGDPAAGIQDVWVTYTNGLGTWTSLPLAPTAVSSVWKAQLASVPSNLRYVVQAANGYGLVAFDDNRGLYYRLGGVDQAATALAITAVRSTTGAAVTSEPFGDSVVVGLALTAEGGAPVAGKDVWVAVGSAARVSVTDANGVASVSVPLVTLPGDYKIVVSFAGDDLLLGSAAATPFAVTKAPTTLPLSGVDATLTATLGLNADLTPRKQPLMQESVQFTLWQNAAPFKTFYVDTDYLGRASMPPPQVPAGNYTLTAFYAGNATYAPSGTSSTGPYSAQAQDISFGTLPASVEYPSSITFTVSSESGTPVTVTLAPSGNPGCTLTASGNTYTLTATLPGGDCTLVASADGTITYAPVSVTQSVSITKFVQSITFTSPATDPSTGLWPDRTYGDSFTVGAILAESGNTNPIVYSASPGSICTISGSTVTIVGAGTAGTPATCTVTASQAGDTFYADATASRSFNVARATLIVTPTVNPASFTFGDDVGSGAVVVAYDVTASGINVSACVLDATKTFAGKPTTTPAPAKTSYSITASYASVSTACDVTTNVATLTVNKAQSAFASLAVTPQTGAAGQTITITGKLNRADRPAIYPTGGDLAGGAFNITVTQGGTALRTYHPTPGGTDGTFSVTDATLPVGNYAVLFSYGGGPNFLAATSQSALLRVEGFTAAASMVQERSYHTATLLDDGRVLVAGGVDATGTPTATAEVYCPSTMPTPTGTQCPNGIGQWSAVGNLPAKAVGHTATLLANGTVVVIGGGNSSAQLFDPSTNQWTPGGGISARSYHTATLLPDGRVFIAGGSDNSGKALQTTVLYNPTTGSSTSGPMLLVARERHTATVLANGKVLIAGGRQNSGKNYIVLNSTEIYDPANSATPIVAGPSMAGKRYLHDAAELLDGRVVAAGGSADTKAAVSGSLASAEVYCPASLPPSMAPLTAAQCPGGFNKWTALASANALQQARRDFTLTELADGRLLAVGGAGNTSTLATSELYRPDAFTLGASMVPPPSDPSRAGHTATLLVDGQVLVTGGTSATGVSTSSTQLYSGPPTTP
jgi:hypothetical protein